MTENSELLRVPVFTGLPDDQISWFIAHAEELALKAGETYFREGDPADAMFVILDGQIQIRGDLGGETVVFLLVPGNVTGVLPFSRMQQFTVGGGGGGAGGARGGRPLPSPLRFSRCRHRDERLRVS